MFERYTPPGRNIIATLASASAYSTTRLIDEDISRNNEAEPFLGRNGSSRWSRMLRSCEVIDRRIAGGRTRTARPCALPVVAGGTMASASSPIRSTSCCQYSTRPELHGRSMSRGSYRTYAPLARAR